MTDTTIAQTECPPMPLTSRWNHADRVHLLQHAQRLEDQMRLLTALLEGRDAGGHGTSTSTRAIAEAKRLAGIEP